MRGHSDTIGQRNINGGLQFGLYKNIPDPLHNLDKVHHIDMRGHSDTIGQIKAI